MPNATETTTPFVEVRGESQLKVVPDQFVLHLNVRSFDKILDKASKENRRRVIAVTKAMKAMGAVLGSRVDKTMSIKELSNASSSRQNFTYRAETPDLGDGFPLDKIVITKKVIVKLAIK